MRTALAILGAVVLLSSCGTPTQITSEWRDPSYRAGSMRRIVVFAPNAPVNSRAAIEDRLAADLGKRGVAAAPAHAVLTPSVVNWQVASEKFVEKGFEGALTVDVREVETRSHFVPDERFYGSPSTYPGSTGYRGGRVVSDRVVRVETSLIDLRDGKRVWTANTKTENATSDGDFAKSLSKEVVPELAEKGLVPTD